MLHKVLIWSLSIISHDQRRIKSRCRLKRGLCIFNLGSRYYARLLIIVGDKPGIRPVFMRSTDLYLLNQHFTLIKIFHTHRLTQGSPTKQSHHTITAFIQALSGVNQPMALTH